MSKNNKKASLTASLSASLIPLGQKNKPRLATTSVSTAKKVKIEDFNPSTLISTIEQSIKLDNGTSETLIINFLNNIKATLINSSKNGKILPSQCLALFSICKKFPNLFTKTLVVDCMCGILCYNGKESANIGSSNFAQKLVQPHSITAAKLKQLHIAICGMLLSSFKDSQKWPLQLLKSYLDDSFADRVWVDLPECNLLVRNIETAFPSPGIDPRTLFPLASISEQLSEINEFADVTITDLTESSEATMVDTINKIISALSADELIRPRFEFNRNNVDIMVTGYIRDNVERKYIPESQTKNILRAFCSLSGLPEMRGAVVTKLDNWLSSKSQQATMNMLTIMANSCNQNIAQNPQDVVFCVYLMLKFKYKPSKAQIQISLLECLKRISEMHPNNLRNILNIYVNNELYGTPTLIHGATINQATTTTTSVGALANKAVVTTLPAIYFRFPSESIKILGDLLHEQICVNFADIKQVKVLIRDICRWIKQAHPNPGSIYSSFTTTGSLPDCIDLLELAQSLLADRSNSENLVARLNNPSFKQSYVDNMINVLCELQMQSILRPSVKDALKIEKAGDHEKKGDLDSVRHHYTTLRQIRYLACKWLKTVYRLVESHVPSDRMTFYMRQVMFLTLTRSNDQNYAIDDFHAINEVFGNDPDKMFYIKGLTEIPLSEKLIHTMMSLGFEKNLCYRPSEIVEMLSELIIRASASASTDIMPMNVTKGETVINNMFACCSYDIALEDSDPKLQVAKTLAYKSSFWKVCQALVIMACHCADSCGAFLWANFPTIKNLMKIVITNNFENSNIEEEALETERLHCQMDANKVSELGSSLYGDNAEDAALFDSNNSELVNILMLNLPQGPTRQPPRDVLLSLKSMNSFMKIGDRLSQCRSPDFLLEIVKGQDQTKVANRKWIIDLVKKTSEQNLECLPLLCLTEFIYHDLYDKISKQVPMAPINDTFRRLVQQIRQILAAVKPDSIENLMRIVGAFSNSFFNRLSDAAASTRNIARECLFILLQPIGSPIAYMTDTTQFMDTLKSLVNVKLFQENSLICSVVESLKETLKFETDINILCCYIELFASMCSGACKDWLVGVVDTVATMILNRPIITEKLKANDYKIVKTGSSTTPVSDLLAEIFLSHINYISQAAAIAIDHQDNVVMVTWKDKKVPMNIRVIQCQLSFLCWGIVKSTACKKLSDVWFVKTAKTFELPQFSGLSPTDVSSSDGLVPQWLVNAAVNSGLVPALTAIVNYHVKHNHRITHNITPALLFMSPEFIGAYLKLMNTAVKEEKPMLEAWILEVKKKESALSTVEKLYSKVKRISTVFLDFLKSHSKDGHLPVTQKANFEPNIIVKPLVKLSETTEDGEMMDTDDQMENVWSELIQSYDPVKGLPVGRISHAINRLLAADGNDIKSIIGDLIKLLKDSKTHSETLRVLNKSDFKLLPLLKLTFRSTDQDSYNFCIESFNYLFNSYPHIEKLSAWKMAYNLCLIQGSSFAETSESSTRTDDDDPGNGQQQHQHQSYTAMVKALVTDIMHGTAGDCKRTTVGKGAKIDQLTVLGLGNSNIGDDSYDVIHRLLFSSHSLYQYSAYFMSDLLHQSTIESLRHILHSLLQKKALSNLNASRALDFIDACIHHPKLQFPGMLIASKRHLWPQQNMQFEITDQELVNLLGLIINESDHLVQHNGLNSDHVNRVLGKRCELVDVCSSHPSMIGQRFTIVHNFLDSKPHNPTIEKLTFALYSRLPNLILYDQDTGSGSGSGLVTVDNDVFFSNVNCFGTDVLHVLGKRLLGGLISPRSDVQDLAIQACKAMVHRHRRLSVQLLPNIVALSDGALDSMECWLTFKKKRGNVLYSCLLHLLEIMVPYSLARDDRIRTDVCGTLGNFLRLLIRYRDQAAMFVGFVTRLVNFIEKLIGFGGGGGCSGGGATNFVEDKLPEIVALSKKYPQFKNLIGYGHRGKDAVSHPTTTTTTAVGAVADMESSRSLSLQLDCLDNFRTEMAKCQQYGAGIGHCFKMLMTTSDSATTSTITTALCLDDLRRALASPMDEARKMARQYVARYLNCYPDQAARFVSDCLIGTMMQSSYYWSRPFAYVALSTLRQVAMLAPDRSPVCLANYGRLFIAGNNGRGNFKDSVSLLEEILDNISLESFLDVADVPAVHGPPASLAPAPPQAPMMKDGQPPPPGITTAMAMTTSTTTMAASQKRHMPPSDHDSHRAKKQRFK